MTIRADLRVSGLLNPGVGQSEGIADLTYGLFLGQVKIQVGDHDLGRESVPLLGFVEELLRAVKELSTKSDSLIDWLGGGSPLHLNKMGCALALTDGDFTLQVPLVEFARATVHFVESTFDQIKRARSDLRINTDFNKWVADNEVTLSEIKDSFGI